MKIAIDFDGTIVDDSHDYDDLKTPLTFLPGAREALYSLKAADHVLLLWSGRASRALLEDPMLDPLVRSGAKMVDRYQWEAQLPINRARYDQMHAFVRSRLPGVFAAIDDGWGGKPSVDLFIDDRAVSAGISWPALGWSTIATVFGGDV